MFKSRYMFPDLLFVVACAVLAIGLSWIPQDGHSSCTTSRTLVTAAHLGEIDGYTCVYTDTDTDFAIYVKQNYCAEGLAVGDSVALVGTSGTVVSTTPVEFAVQVENISQIVPGVSGKPVYLRGEPVGFISGWNGAGALRCIFY